MTIEYKSIIDDEQRTGRCTVQRWEGGRLVKSAEFRHTYNMMAHTNASVFIGRMLMADQETDEHGYDAHVRDYNWHMAYQNYVEYYAEGRP